MELVKGKKWLNKWLTYLISSGQQFRVHLLEIGALAGVDIFQHFCHNISIHIFDFRFITELFAHIMLEHGTEDGRASCENGFVGWKFLIADVEDDIAEAMTLEQGTEIVG